MINNKLTVEQVKELLPDIKVMIDNKLITCTVSGRKEKFARIHYNGMLLTMTHRYILTRSIHHA